MNESIIKLFREYFSGNETGYGVAEIFQGVDERGKNNYKHATKLNTSITPSVIKNHLEGVESVGMSPLKSDGTCSFGVIDVDQYKNNDQVLNSLLSAISNNKFALCPFFSKSRGLHLYLFFKEPTPATEVRKLLEWYRTALNLPRETEIFPKQTRIDPGTIGSWINLPYFKAEDPTNPRKMIHFEPIGNPSLLSLEDALQEIEKERFTYEQHKSLVEDIPYFGAPPCILHGYVLRNVRPGTRNDFLFNAYVYLNQKDAKTAYHKLTLLNGMQEQPLPEGELAAMMAGFAKKARKYNYKCPSDCPSVISCPKKGAVDGFQPAYGQLYQIMSIPIQWEWEVDGAVLHFEGSDFLERHSIFRKAYAEALPGMPVAIPKETWLKITSEAVRNKIVKNVDIFSYQNSIGGLLRAAFMDAVCVGNISCKDLEEFKKHCGEHRRATYKDDSQFFLSGMVFGQFCDIASHRKLRFSSLELTIFKQAMEIVEAENIPDARVLPAAVVDEIAQITKWW